MGRARGRSLPCVDRQNFISADKISGSLHAWILAARKNAIFFSGFFLRAVEFITEEDGWGTLNQGAMNKGEDTRMEEFVTRIREVEASKLSGCEPATRWSAQFRANAASERSDEDDSVVAIRRLHGSSPRSRWSSKHPGGSWDFGFGFVTCEHTREVKVEPSLSHAVGTSDSIAPARRTDSRLRDFRFMGHESNLHGRALLQCYLGGETEAGELNAESAGRARRHVVIWESSAESSDLATSSFQGEFSFCGHELAQLAVCRAAASDAMRILLPVRSVSV
ncbi:hypothetical protein ABZP36_007437 [Zizania latifolia]